jgi:hypothetical protein
LPAILYDPKIKNILKTTEILSTLDSCNEDGHFDFINLEHPYVYLIDGRLNVFRNDYDKWAIVSEVLGYNTRGWGYAVTLEIRYFGNCLTNLEIEGGKSLNYYNVLPIDWDNFNETVENEVLKSDAKFWIVRGVKIPLSHNRQDYIEAGIELKEYEPSEIAGEEVARLVVEKHRNIFRATNDELYKSIPKDLDKLLVIDKWYHKNYEPLYVQHIDDEKIRIAFEVGKHFAGEKNYIDFETFVTDYKRAEQGRYNESLKKWRETQPSSYETWQQIAKVIATGDSRHYKPASMPNSHWKNWPEGGAM